MKTAEWYIKQHLGESAASNKSLGYYYIENAINEARKDAIRLCARKATTKVIQRTIGESYEVVDKKAILNLVDKVK